MPGQATADNRIVPHGGYQLSGWAGPTEDGRHEHVDVQNDFHEQRSAAPTLPAVCGDLLNRNFHRLVVVEAVSLPEPVEHARAHVSPDGSLDDLVL